MASRAPSALRAAFALGCLLSLSSPGTAQSMNWGMDFGRAVRPGAYVPFDGAPFSERYNYEEALPYFPGMSPRQAWTAYEIDRQERFAKFGTRYGPDHPPIFNRLLDRHRR